LSPRTTLAFSILCPLLLAACGPDRWRPPPCRQAPVEVEVGTGLATFDVMPGGADLPFFFGPQGGYHVYGSVRTRGFAAGNPDDPFDLTHPMVAHRLWWGEMLIAEVPAQPRPLEPMGDGSEVSVGQLVIIRLANPLELEGQTVELEAQVSDRCGESGTDRRSGVMRFAGPV
jgi:hypothetical protein